MYLDDAGQIPEQEMCDGPFSHSSGPATERRDATIKLGNDRLPRSMLLRHTSWSVDLDEEGHLNSKRPNKSVTHEVEVKDAGGRRLAVNP